MEIISFRGVNYILPKFFFSEQNVFSGLMWSIAWHRGLLPMLMSGRMSLFTAPLLLPVYLSIMPPPRSE